jgi:hypothetical protein
LLRQEASPRWGELPQKKIAGPEAKKAGDRKKEKEEEVGSSKLEETKCNEEESQANG